MGKGGGGKEQETKFYKKNKNLTHSAFLKKTGRGRGQDMRAEFLPKNKKLSPCSSRIRSCALCSLPALFFHKKTGKGIEQGARDDQLSLTPKISEASANGELPVFFQKK